MCLLLTSKYGGAQLAAPGRASYPQLPKEKSGEESTEKNSHNEVPETDVREAGETCLSNTSASRLPLPDEPFSSSFLKKSFSNKMQDQRTIQDVMTSCLKGPDNCNQTTPCLPNSVRIKSNIGDISYIDTTNRPISVQNDTTDRPISVQNRHAYLLHAQPGW